MSPKLACVNGLRGIAILGVVWHHLYAAPARIALHSFHLGNVLVLPLVWLSNGWLGVNLFFILSGFVLCVPYVDKRRTMDSMADVGRFYLHRGARLLPLYYISLFICITLNGQDTLASIEFLKTLAIMCTMTFNFFSHHFMPPCNRVLWALGVEVWFSILFPVLLFMYGKKGVWWLLIPILLLGFVARHEGVHHMTIRDGIPGRLDEFALGMCLAHFFVHRPQSRWFRHPGLCCAGAVLLLTIGMHARAYSALNILPLRGSIGPFINTVLDAGCCLAVISALGARRGIVHFVFANRPLQLLGMMCFSVYIWHAVIITRMLGPDVLQRNWALVPPCLAVVLLLSLLSYRYVEFGNVKDLMRLLPEKDRDRHQQPAIGSTALH